MTTAEAARDLGVLYSACRRRFHNFVRVFWRIADPTSALVDSPYVAQLCDELQALYEGRTSQLLVNMPPGLGKSIISSVLFSAWIWARDPSEQMLYATYLSRLTRRDSMRTRMVLESPLYRTLFAQGWKLRVDQNRLDDIGNTAGGRRLSTSRDAGTTGERGSITIFDDPDNAQKIWSPTERQRTKDFFRLVLSTRQLLGRPHRMGVIQHRLHVDDMSSALLKEGGWRQLCLRAREGETLISPLLAPLEDLEKRRGTWQAQYQQEPLDPKTQILPRDRWRFWRPVDSNARKRRPIGCCDEPALELDLSQLRQLIISYDPTSGSEKGGPSYDVIQVWAIRGADCFLLDQVRDRFPMGRALTELKAMVQKWPHATRKLVEAKAAGPAIMSLLSREITGLTPVEPALLGNKEARARACSPQIDSGNVFLPEGAHWLDEFVAECEAFPGQGDDQVDAMTQALNYLAGRGDVADKWRRRAAAAS